MREKDLARGLDIAANLIAEHPEAAAQLARELAGALRTAGEEREERDTSERLARARAGYRDTF